MLIMRFSHKNISLTLDYFNKTFQTVLLDRNDLDALLKQTQPT